jgi:hypothetical protein
MQSLAISIRYSLDTFCGFIPDDMDVPATCAALEGLIDNAVSDAYEDEYDLDLCVGITSTSASVHSIRVYLDDDNRDRAEAIRFNINHMTDEICGSGEWERYLDENGEE